MRPRKSWAGSETVAAAFYCVVAVHLTVVMCERSSVADMESRVMRAE